MWIDPRFALPNGKYATHRSAALRAFVLVALAAACCAALAVGFVVSATAPGDRPEPAAAAWLPGVLAALFAAAALVCARAAFPRTLTVDDDGARGLGWDVRWDEPLGIHVAERVLFVHSGGGAWGLWDGAHAFSGLRITDTTGRVRARLLSCDWDAALLEALALRAAQRPLAAEVSRSSAVMAVLPFLMGRRVRS